MLRVERTRVGLIPGTTLTLNVEGASGRLTARSSDPSVDARYNALGRQLVLSGRGPGKATVSLVAENGNGANVEVLVAPAAGVVPADATVRLAGTVSPAFALAQIGGAVAALAGVRAGAALSVTGVTIAAPLQPGDVLEARAQVRIDGRTAFVDQAGTTSVHLSVDALPALEPGLLFYSDDPERLNADADGVLYRNTIDTTRSARVYAYHVSDVSGRRLYLALRSVGAGARVQLLGSAAGPTGAFGYVGHVSTLRYLFARRTQESAIVSVGVDAPYLVPLGTAAMKSGDLIAAIFDLRVLAGDPVDVEVLSATGDASPAELAAGPELPGDGHGRRGEFGLHDVPPLSLAYTTGEADPPPFQVGLATLPNLRVGGRPLGGDYGVLRSVALDMKNPGSVPAGIYLYETPAGGTATTTMWFAGDERPTEIPCVRLAAKRYLVKAFSLGPGETRTVSGEYMTDGTSSFPLLFGLTGTQPFPPPGPYDADACNPRPAPAASPSAPPSGTPSLPSAPPAPSPSSSPAPTSSP